MTGGHDRAETKDQGAVASFSETSVTGAFADQLIS